MTKHCESCGQSLPLTEKDRAHIRSSKLRLKDLARQYGRTESAIWAIKHKEAKREARRASRARWNGEART